MVLEIWKRQIEAGENLSQAEMTEVINLMMQGRCAPEEMGPFLLALRAKGEAVSEIAGAARALRQHMTPIRTRQKMLVDTCGPGGVSSTLFNISTTAALVTAAAGVSVAKHGNRGVTSRSGSADVLAALGVNIEASVPQVERCLDELGIGFCFAPALHPAMKHVAPVRKQLGVRTIFNLLGPLCNPAGAPFQLMGVGDARVRPLMAEALQLLGTERALVVRGHDGVGELTLSGPSQVTLVEGAQRSEHEWRPRDAGLQESPLDALHVANAEASASIVRGVLNGVPGPARDIVVYNAAAAIWLARSGQSLLECAAQAAAAIHSGAARDLLARLVFLSHAAAGEQGLPTAQAPIGPA